MEECWDCGEPMKSMIVPIKRVNLHYCISCNPNFDVKVFLAENDI